jgi:signal transduction histidine kinase
LKPDDTTTDTMERPALAFSSVASFTEALLTSGRDGDGLRDALAVIARQLSARSMHVWSLDEGEQLNRVMSWPSLDEDGAPTCLPMMSLPSAVERTLRRGEAVEVPLDPRMRAMMNQPSDLSMSWAPMLVGERLTGVLCARRDASLGEWNDQELALMRATASVLSTWLERARREREARERAGELDRILESVEQVVFKTDATGVLTYLNAAWGRLLEHPIERSVGRSFMEYVDPVDHGVVVSRLLPLLREEVTFCRIKLTMLTSTKAPRLVELFARRLYSETGAFLGITGTLRDHSEERWEQHFKRERAREEGMRRFASRLSHELNNILQVTLVAVDMTREDMARAGAPGLEDDPLADVRAGLERVQKVSAELNAFAQGSHASGRVELGGVVVEAATRVGSRATRATIDVDVSSALWAGKGDAYQLRLAIEHLISNAAESSSSPRVQVTALNTTVEALDVAVTEHGLLPGDYTCVMVRDDGDGMSQDLLARAREPFETLKPGRRGMGLSVAYAVASSHRGALVVKSTPGRGTSVMFYIPRHPELTTTTPATPAPVGRRPRLLLADDEPRVRRTLSKALRRKGYDVTDVEDGPSALEALADPSADFDAAIMDYIMPGLHGIPLLERLRAQNPELPILVCTGDRLGAHAIAQNFDDIPVLLKPYTIAQISALLEELTA